MKNIYGLTIKELEEEMVALEQKKFRATQLFTWLYKNKAKSKAIARFTRYSRSCYLIFKSPFID